MTTDIAFTKVGCPDRSSFARRSLRQLRAIQRLKAATSSTTGVGGALFLDRNRVALAVRQFYEYRQWYVASRHTCGTYSRFLGSELLWAQASVVSTRSRGRARNSTRTRSIASSNPVSSSIDFVENERMICYVASNRISVQFNGRIFLAKITTRTCCQQTMKASGDRRRRLV